MKRAGSLLLALALASAGCVEMPMWTDAKPPMKEPVFTPEPPPVRPDQVNDANARAGHGRPAQRTESRGRRAGVRPAFGSMTANA